MYTFTTLKEGIPELGDITPKEKYLAENKPTKINYNYI